MKDEVRLAPRIDSIVKVRLSTRERELYESSRRCVLQIVDHVYTNGEVKGFCGILQSILTLRQICDYGINTPSTVASKRLQSNPEGSGLFLEHAMCELCNESFKPQESEIESSLLTCLHVLCALCIVKRSKKGCSLCMGNTAFDELKDDNGAGYDKNKSWINPSSKALALLKNIRSYQTASSEKPVKRSEF